MTDMNRYTATQKSEASQLVRDIETFLNKYVTFSDSCYSLPLALWILGTFVFPEFDAFPYLVITADTKRSGKTRLSELISFSCSNPRQFAAMTAATLYRSIDQEQPTIIFDEAETLSSESASTMRAVLNVGYRKGQTIPRMVGSKVYDFKAFCPKIFILIGDVYDTLKDRSVIVRMRRGEPRERFVYESVKAEGEAIRERVAASMELLTPALAEAFLNHKGLDFMTDRDEEIWIPLFTLAAIFCPDRIEELSRHAVDIATEKTQEARRYVNLMAEEEKAQDDEYAKRLLNDLYGLLCANGKVISTNDAIERLKAIPTAPWRKFRGSGLTIHNMADMLSRFGVRPVNVRIGNGRKDSKVVKGYKFESLDNAVKGGK